MTSARHRRNSALLLALQIGAVVAVLIFIGLVLLIRNAGLSFGRFSSEFDGTRPLIAGYELAMLEGFPRQILETTPRLGETQLLIPPDPGFAGEEQVGLYVISGGVIAGHIVPFDQPTGTGHTSSSTRRKFFLLDSSQHRVDYFSERAEWSAACAKHGINVDATEWQWPNPGG